MKTNLLILALLLSLSSVAAAGGFSHEVHVTDMEMACVACHPAFSTRAVMPTVESCTDCHEAEDVAAVLVVSPLSHFGDYRHEHAFDATASTGDCAFCHGASEDCVLCHQGENLDFLSHDRNHRYNHALDALKGTENCYACHGDQDYCNSCHLAEGVQPANHFMDSFLSGDVHGQAARDDLESCMLCHDGPEPTGSCASCHPLD